MGEHALEEAARAGYRAMQFNFVVSTNGAAVSLWKKLGFAVVGTVPQAFRHREQGLVDAQAKLVSISIDPEFDTPERLREYALKFGATSQWQHYTGSRQAVLAVQKAFNVYRGDKMNHFAVTFLRGAPAQPWVRLEGFATPDDIAREYRRIAGS